MRFIRVLECPQLIGPDDQAYLDDWSRRTLAAATGNPRQCLPVPAEDAARIGRIWPILEGQVDGLFHLLILLRQMAGHN